MLEQRLDPLTVSIISFLVGYLKNSSFMSHENNRGYIENAFYKHKIKGEAIGLLVFLNKIKGI